MDAKTAKEQANKTIEDQRKKQRKADLLEEKKEKAAIKRALETRYEPFLKKCMDEIFTAVSKGQFDTAICFNGSFAGDKAVAYKAKEELEAKGFKVKPGHWGGYVEYGDTEAPCRMYEEKFWFDVSW